MQPTVAKLLTYVPQGLNTLCVVYENQSINDGHRNNSNWFCDPYTTQTQKFTLWAECRVILMLQLLVQFNNHYASMHYTVVHINYMDDMGI